MKTIVQFKEKHTERFFDASTPELLAKACAKVLKERLEEGYWYIRDYEQDSLKLTEDETELLAMSEAQLKALPESISAELKEKRAKIAKRQANYLLRKKQEDKWFDELNQVINTPLDEVHLLPGRGWYGKKGYALPVALVYDRSDYQYEGFELTVLEEV